ncbi:hypothetical protein ACFWNT_14395 [Streptomyces sp. NPDC058409]|uniref:hypothetical protein n=1 Tax=Streptomyces sp. NPDC058409 TaxID=3346484 RepID=UPI003664F750
MISFLHAQALDADELSETPAQLLTDVQHQVHPHIPDLSQERRDEEALRARITQLPAPMASQLSTWVRVLCGCGRYRHPRAGFRRIRRYCVPPGLP